MSVRYVVSGPADLGRIYALNAERCHRAAEAISVKSLAREWRTKAEVWRECAEIANATTFQPDQEASNDATL